LRSTNSASAAVRAWSEARSAARTRYSSESRVACTFTAGGTLTAVDAAGAMSALPVASAGAPSTIVSGRDPAASASSTMACALMPPKPKALTPARRGPGPR
jgi:hypothetical protein